MIRFADGYFTPADAGRWRPADQWRALVMADFDGDGRAEVAGCPTAGPWVVGRYEDGRFVTRAWAPAFNTARLARVLTGDFDGDGKTDVAGFEHNGRLWVGRSTGTTFAFGVWGRWAKAGWLVVQAGDVDGDGKTDLVGYGRRGDWWAGRSTGNRFITARWARDPVPTPPARVHVGDFDGNGRADVLLVRSTGAARLALSTGTAFRVRAAGSVPAGTAEVGRSQPADAADRLVVHARGTVFGWLTAGRFAFTRPPAGELPPWHPAAPWSPHYSRLAFDGVPPGVKRALSFNTEANRDRYVRTYQGVLRGWVREATAARLTGPALNAFLRRRLDALFARVRPELARRYPGLAAHHYRLLMTMNLAHAYFAYGRQPRVAHRLADVLPLAVGDCSEYANLLAWLARLQGRDAKYLQIVSVFESPAAGQFGGAHAVVYSDGLILDGQTNTALRVDLAGIRATPPELRMKAVINTGGVFGFYNWYLSPAVRAPIMAGNKEDPGIFIYYFTHYLAGLGQGKSTETLFPPGPLPVS